MSCALSRAGTFVGVDVHKRRLVSVLLLPSGELRERTFDHDGRGLLRLVRWVRSEAVGGVELCYEAGPCGFEPQRRLVGHGLVCRVIAPSLVPRKPGDRVKTDRRDARKLAELLRAGLLTEVHPPTAEEEAERDLLRCREDARRALHSARQQVRKFLDRQGLSYRGNSWTRRYWEWLRSIRLATSAGQWAFDAWLLAVEQAEARVVDLDAKIAQLSESERHREAVGRLRCFRGIDTYTAMVLRAELHSFGRFVSPRELMSYLGLTPSEESSGDRERRGGITKTGNRHVRRLLIEAAWHYLRRPSVGGVLSRRRDGQPGWVIALADRTMQRLYRRYHRLVARGKSSAVAAVAVARELAGSLWAVLREEPQAA